MDKKNSPKTNSLLTELETYALLNAKVNPIVPEGILETVVATLQDKQKLVIGNHNLHSLYLCEKDKKFRTYYEKFVDFTYIDGMPIILAGRLCGMPFERRQRVTLLDLVYDFLDVAAEKNWRIYWLGGVPEVSKLGGETLRERIPSLQLDTHHGYFDLDSRDNDQVVEEINASNADVLMIGMGMPRQEHWILANYDRLNVPVLWPCGATLDYIAGAIPTPPRWMGRVGLEWFYRLVSEPRRLSHRYLVEPWSLLPMLTRDVYRYRFRGESPVSTPFPTQLGVNYAKSRGG